MEKDGSKRGEEGRRDKEPPGSSSIQMKTITGTPIHTNKLLCHLCGILCTNSFTFSRHVHQKHESTYRYECHLCFYETERKDNLVRHYRTVHKLTPPYPENRKMPPRARFENKQNNTNKNKPTTASTSTARPREAPDDYNKYLDSTGAYVYFHTLRKDQRITTWAPKVRQLINTEVPQYSSNNTEYPRLDLSPDTRFIPLYTETLSDDEYPHDPRQVIPDANQSENPDNNTANSSVEEIPESALADPGETIIEIALDDPVQETTVVQENRGQINEANPNIENTTEITPEDTNEVEVLSPAENVMDIQFTDEDIAAIEALLDDFSPNDAPAIENTMNTPVLPEVDEWFPDNQEVEAEAEAEANEAEVEENPEPEPDSIFRLESVQSDHFINTYPDYPWSLNEAYEELFTRDD